MDDSFSGAAHPGSTLDHVHMSAHLVPPFPGIPPVPRKRSAVPRLHGVKAGSSVMSGGLWSPL